jgi:Multicopper oxidase
LTRAALRRRAIVAVADKRQFSGTTNEHALQIRALALQMRALGAGRTERRVMRWQEPNLDYLQTEPKSGRQTPLTSWVLTELRRPAELVGGVMRYTRCWVALAVLSIVALPALGQSFRVQCPTSTITHPSAPDTEPAYAGPTAFTLGANGYLVPTPATVNGAIKCQQISGGDGYATMGDGTQTYMFSFGPLSGLTDIANGQPGTEVPSTFNALLAPGTYLSPGDPDTSGLGTLLDQHGHPYNGAVGLAMDVPNLVTIYDISVTGTTVLVVANAPLGVKPGDMVTIAGTGTPYDGTFPVLNTPVVNPFFAANLAFTVTNAAAAGQAEITESTTATAAVAPRLDGHVDPRPILDVGVMNGNIPAPLMAIDEDDEYFLTLTNVGMMMRPDLFEQHTVHFHGYPNASAFYDGVPDASVAINIGGSFTYYYLAPDAGTYFWHCHITPPEHLQMGMVGQLYVRPRQNRVRVGTSLYTARVSQNTDLRTACVSVNDILCSNPLPAANTVARNTTGNYAYNDGDGSTYYDVEYPLQIHGFDPNFHFVGMTFNPEGFSDMKDKYFLLNGRSYPDTVTTGPLQTVSADGTNHFSQPLPAVINITAGQRALLRISDLDVTEYQTLASLGIRMQVVGYNAKLLRDQAGNNLYYATNSITLGGGESLDVILDTCAVRPVVTGTTTPIYTSCTTPMATGTYFLYTPNLDHLSNDAENFGGLMTEVHVTN